MKPFLFWPPLDFGHFVNFFGRVIFGQVGMARRAMGETQARQRVVVDLAKAGNFFWISLVVNMHINVKICLGICFAALFWGIGAGYGAVPFFLAMGFLSFLFEGAAWTTDPVEPSAEAQESPSQCTAKRPSGYDEW